MCWRSRGAVLKVINYWRKQEGDENIWGHRHVNGIENHHGRLSSRECMSTGICKRERDSTNQPRKKAAKDFRSK